MKTQERGQALIMCVLVMVVVMGMVSLAIDVGLFLHDRGKVQNAVDAAALAGAQELPDFSANAASLADQYAMNNDADLSNVDISFRCLVGDRDGDNLPDLSDIPAACDPGAGASFTCRNGICWAACDPGAGDKCNTIVVGGNKDVPFYFGPVLSILGGPSQCFHDQCNTGSIRAAACRGSCGGPPHTPLDVVMVIDRTTSLCSNSSNPCSGAGLNNLNNIKDGAKAALQIFNPAMQHVGLGILPKSIPGNDCASVTSNTNPGNWMITDLSSDFNTGGVLNPGSEIVGNVNCMQMATAYGLQTNLGDPVAAAKQHLQTNGRAGVKQAIILLTDGAANQPSNSGSTGFRNCGNQGAVAGGDNNGFQSNPAAACTDGSGNATDTDSGTNTSTSCTNAGKDRHIFRDYSISLPAGATVTGISVRLDAWVDSASGTRSMCADLSWNGGASWTTAKQTPNLGTSQTSNTLGSASDTWGHPWTAAETSNASFILRVTDVSSVVTRDFALDWAAVQVHYMLPGFGLGPCDYANNQATSAKNADIELFVIGFGVDSETCDYDSMSSYNGADATELLADMATASADDHGHCASAAAITAENEDGDNFLCEAKSGAELEPIFKQAVEQLTSGSKLVPIVE